MSDKETPSYNSNSLIFIEDYSFEFFGEGSKVLIGMC